MVARWYAPTLGRFISEDTLLGEATRPASRHLYAYAEGEPVGAWDADGHRLVKYWYSRIRNPQRVTGLVHIELFIQAHSVLLPYGIAALAGDNRTYAYTTSCDHARACITINFDGGFVLAQVNESGGWIV